MARHWPSLLATIAYLTSVVWASLALVDLQAAAGVPVSLFRAAAWQALSFGSLVPFGWAMGKLVQRLGLTARLLAILYGCTLLSGAVHALIVLALQWAFVGSPLSLIGLIDRLPIDLLLAVAVVAFVAAARAERMFAAERDRASGLAAALELARAEAVRPAPAGLPAPEPLLVSVGPTRVPVPAASVEWFAAAGNYVVVNWAGREGLLRGTLTSLQAQLDPAMFVRAHRSAIVNLAAMRETAPLSDGGWVLRTETGGEIVLSRTYREAVLERLGRR